MSTRQCADALELRCISHPRLCVVLHAKEDCASTLDVLNNQHTLHGR